MLCKDEALEVNLFVQIVTRILSLTITGNAAISRAMVVAGEVEPVVGKVAEEKIVEPKPVEEKAWAQKAAGNPLQLELIPVDYFPNQANKN